LRTVVFVPQVPFRPNGFYRAVVKTDTEQEDGSIERGVRDLAGNPLDNEFFWTFRTTDAPFEEQWSITLRADDGSDIDANNIAGVEFQAEDTEDERDARSVPSIDAADQLRLSFLNASNVEYDRDIRPADGRLGHHWFFVVGNAASDVTLYWRPSLKLARSTRQYQVMRLIEFDAAGKVSNVIPLHSLLPTDPNQVFDPATGEINEFEAHTYTPGTTESARYFRLDVQKASFVATTFDVGSSGWQFFSAPITPQRDDPFVNLGDDIDPFKLYQYNTELGGYKVYPLDIGEVSLITGNGYFTRLDSNIEVDIGGTSNMEDMNLGRPSKPTSDTNPPPKLNAIGWHAIGNPFVQDVNVADLEFDKSSVVKGFDDAVTAGWIESKLYRWKVAPSGTDAYEAVGSTGKLNPWDGYWLKTLVADLKLTVAAPSGLDGLVPAHWQNGEEPFPDSFKPPTAPSVVDGKGGEGRDGIFALRLELTSAFASDVTTTLGTHENAMASWDVLDTSEPPILGQTVAVYFEHKDWDDQKGLYNTDYQPALEIGESRVWNLTVFTDRPNTEMTLLWKDAIGQTPDDTMLWFRQSGETQWGDMRQVESVELKSQSSFTKIRFEIRAERYAMTPLADVTVVAGEKQVKVRWKADDNPFISGYTIARRTSEESQPTLVKLRSNASTFIDTDVEEEMTYTYQLSVRFKSGAELRGELLTVTVKPTIKETALRQNYPNPFNPETWIPYELAQEVDVRIDIYSASGQLVRTLELGRQPRGRYVRQDKAAYWDGRTRLGERAASGVYFYVLKAGNFSATQKMVILK